MLRAVAGDADRVRFLEGVGADQLRRNLPGDDDHRDGIEQRVGDAGDRVGRAGPRRDEHDARLAGGAGIALRHVRRALFVADEHVADRGMIIERVIDGQHRAARITEHDFDAQIDQAFDQNVRAALFGHDETPLVGASRVFAPGHPRWQGACL